MRLINPAGPGQARLTKEVGGRPQQEELDERHPGVARVVRDACARGRSGRREPVGDDGRKGTARGIVECRAKPCQGRRAPLRLGGGGPQRARRHPGGESLSQSSSSKASQGRGSSPRPRRHPPRRRHRPPRQPCPAGTPPGRHPRQAKGLPVGGSAPRPGPRVRTSRRGRPSPPVPPGAPPPGTGRASRRLAACSPQTSRARRLRDAPVFPLPACDVSRPSRRPP